MKKVIHGIALVICLGFLYLQVGTFFTPTDQGEEIQDDINHLNTETFKATLEEVNTGCFADGECFIKAGGKHVTAIMGWSRETVGSVKGVEGFGDLYEHIGKTVEVYARKTDANKYTLYGDESYYIELQR